MSQPREWTCPHCESAVIFPDSDYKSPQARHAECGCDPRCQTPEDFIARARWRDHPFEPACSTCGGWGMDKVATARPSGYLAGMTKVGVSTVRAAWDLCSGCRGTGRPLTGRSSTA